jgi:hypothetical protein
MAKRCNFLDELSPDDPNYEVGRRFYREGADSHGLVADALAGNVSFEEFLEGCVTTFDQAARAHIAIEDNTSVGERCRPIRHPREEVHQQNY